VEYTSDMKKLITLFFLLVVGLLLGTQKGGLLHTNPTFADVPGGDSGSDSGSTSGDGGSTSVDGGVTSGDGGCSGGGDGDSGCSSGSGCL
jgi:hypothetical protein